MWMYSRGMYASHYPNIKRNTRQPYTMHIFTQLWRKYMRQGVMIIIYSMIKNDHGCGSLSWLLFFHRILSHVPTESSYQQWRQTGLVRPISGLPSIDETSLCAHWQIWVLKIIARCWNVAANCIIVRKSTLRHSRSKSCARSKTSKLAPCSMYLCVYLRKNICTTR